MRQLKPVRVRAVLDPANLPGAKRAPMPARIVPMLAVLTKSAPAGPGWIHEVKFDGYRILAHIHDGKIRLITRNGNDWTNRFSTIAQALKPLGEHSMILDGEAVVLDQHGVSDFQALQNLLKDHGMQRPVYYAFDLLYQDGYDLRAVPLIHRKRALKSLIPPTQDVGELRLSEDIDGDGPAVLREACQMGLEGIVSKRADSIYQSRRSPVWLKSKCGNRQEFVIVGYTDPKGSRRGFGALMLGYYNDEGKLVYAGRVGTGFDELLLNSLHAELRKLEQKTWPTDEPPPKRERRDAHWVEPKLVAEVQFTGWTREGLLRHPAFIAMRQDKPPRQIHRERPIVSPPASKVPVIAGVALSNPTRVLYPEDKIVKHDLARYYEQVAKRMLPHVVDRPLALVRCPQGISHKCFFQKHLTESTPDTIHGIDVSETSTPEFHVYIKDLAGLIQLVQLGVLEIHTWGSRIDDLERPDQMVFDLDPGPKVSWKRVIDAAVALRDLLENLGLSGFVKTSGGKGLHIVVPLNRSAGWDEVKPFTRAIAEHFAALRPKEFVATMSKAQRVGKIYIDYLRNGRGATAVAAYSTRARKGAPVSMPLRWDELSRTKSADEFTVQNAGARVKRQKRDPWHDFEKKRVDLSPILNKALNG